MKTFVPARRTLREALEDALSANPDDRAAHAAYADHLAESADAATSARGRFIACQLRLEDADLSEQLRREIEAESARLQQKHMSDWLGPLGVALKREGHEPRYKLRMCRGWVEQLSVNGPLTSELVGALSCTPALRLVRSFSLDWCPASDGKATSHELLRRLTLCRAFRRLRSLRLSVTAPHCYRAGPQVAQWFRAHPELEHLSLERLDLPVGIVFGHRVWASLRTLLLSHVNPSGLLDLTAAVRTPQLESIIFVPYLLTCNWGLRKNEWAAVETILTTSRLPSLRHAFIKYVACTGVTSTLRDNARALERLDSLALHHAGLTDEHAAQLAALAPRRPVELHIRDEGDAPTANRVSPRGVAMLNAAGWRVVTESRCE